jgi:hypothetical protein
MPEKKKLEKEIQREICDFLNEKGYFFWRQNNTPIFDKKFGGFRAMPKYTYRGLPDIMIILRSALIGIEVKVPDYWKRTDEQVKMKDYFIDNGAFYHIAVSLQEAKDIMEMYEDILPNPSPFKEI